MTEGAANWLLAGGMLGALFRVVLSESKTWRRATILHALMGGFTVVIVPWLLDKLAGVEIVGPPTFLLSFGVAVGGFANYILVAALWKFGVFKEDPRAAKPESGEAPP